mgnify:FL=1
MLTKKVKKRILFLLSILFLSVASIFFILKVLNDNLLYFKTPSEIKKDTNLNFKRAIRIGGMVKQNSLSANSNEIKFIITDMKNEIIVSYSGAIPNLFSEGKGVVAEGKLKDRNYFIAEKILAKHDENYMPPKLKENVK